MHIAVREIIITTGKKHVSCNLLVYLFLFFFSTNLANFSSYSFSYYAYINQMIFFFATKKYCKTKKKYTRKIYHAFVFQMDRISNGHHSWPNQCDSRLHGKRIIYRTTNLILKVNYLSKFYSFFYRVIHNF